MARQSRLALVAFTCTIWQCAGSDVIAQNSTWLLAGVTSAAKRYSSMSEARLHHHSLLALSIDRGGIMGDFVAIGAGEGGSALSLLHAMTPPRALHILDAFEGLTPVSSFDDIPDMSDAALEQAETIEQHPWLKRSPTVEQARRNILSNTDYPRDLIHLHVGGVGPGAFVPDGPIALLQLGLDWYNATAWALEVLYPKVSPGGIIIIDDYGYWQGSKRAVDAFLDDRQSLKLHRMDGDGAYIIKPQGEAIGHVAQAVQASAKRDIEAFEANRELLQQLGEAAGSDRFSHRAHSQWKSHTYDRLYARWLTPLAARKPDFTMLEIGLGCANAFSHMPVECASCELWPTVFPRVKLYYAEVDGECVVRCLPTCPRAMMFVADQTDAPAMVRIHEAAGRPDVIVDDGGHSMLQQLVTLLTLLPRMRPGQLYFLEDLVTSFEPHYHDAGNLITSAVLANAMNIMQQREHLEPDAVCGLPYPRAITRLPRVLVAEAISACLEAIECNRGICLMERNGVPAVPLTMAEEDLPDIVPANNAAQPVVETAPPQQPLEAATRLASGRLLPEGVTGIPCHLGPRPNGTTPLTSPHRYEGRLSMLAGLVPKGGVWAEVGVFKGDFAQAMLDTLQPRELHLIDPWPTGQDILSGDVDGTALEVFKGEELARYVVDRFMGQAMVKVHRGYSYDVIPGLGEGSLDGIYIDGDHSYEGALEDLLLAVCAVKPEGWILGHDYEFNEAKGGHRFEFGVKAAVHQLLALTGYELHALAYDGYVSYAIQRW